MCGESILTVKNQCCVFNGNIRLWSTVPKKVVLTTFLSVWMLFSLSLSGPNTAKGAGPTLLKSSQNLILSQIWLGKVILKIILSKPRFGYKLQIFQNLFCLYLNNWAVSSIWWITVQGLRISSLRKKEMFLTPFLCSASTAFQNKFCTRVCTLVSRCAPWSPTM